MRRNSDNDRLIAGGACDIRCGWRGCLPMSIGYGAQI
jgi:hypothetical protein